jgi:hypothetical protein
VLMQDSLGSAADESASVLGVSLKRRRRHNPRTGTCASVVVHIVHAVNGKAVRLIVRCKHSLLDYGLKIRSM